MSRYRIGQTRDVIVYRLVTCGTVEEKMYARQIWKECVNKQVIEKKSIMKHFTKDELKDLFTLRDPVHSSMRMSIKVGDGNRVDFRNSDCRWICRTIRRTWSFCTPWTSMALGADRGAR